MTKHLSEAERRSQILRAARAVFIEKGFLAARVEDVAKRASLSKGAVYFYFASKRDLFMALVQEEHEATYSFLDQAEEDGRAAMVKLVDLGQKYLDYFAGLKSPPRFFLMMCEQGIRDDEIREECQGRASAVCGRGGASPRAGHGRRSLQGGRSTRRRPNAQSDDRWDGWSKRNRHSS